MIKLYKCLIILLCINNLFNYNKIYAIPIHAIKEHEAKIIPSNCKLYLKNSSKKNSLKQIFYSKKGLFINKWDHYLEIYDSFFNKFRNKKNITILEIGIFQGGSINLWKKFFGKHIKIVGVDIMPKLKILEDTKNNIFIEIGDQSDKNFLQKISKKHGPFDIIIDDGGHQMNEQINSLKYLLQNVKPNGIYVTEDLFSSYTDNPNWTNTGLRKAGTFVEYIKNVIDDLNGEFYKNGVNHNTKLIKSMHFYPSLLIIERSNLKLNDQYINLKSSICGEYGINKLIEDKI